MLLLFVIRAAQGDYWTVKGAIMPQLQTSCDFQSERAAYGPEQCRRARYPRRLIDLIVSLFSES